MQRLAGTSVRLTAQASTSADDEAEQAGPGAEDQRVLQRIDVEPAGEHLAEMVEAHTLLALDAAEQQRQERQHRQHGQRRDGRRPSPRCSRPRPTPGLRRDQARVAAPMQYLRRHRLPPRTAGKVCLNSPPQNSQCQTFQALAAGRARARRSPHPAAVSRMRLMVRLMVKSSSPARSRNDKEDFCDLHHRGRYPEPRLGTGREKHMTDAMLPRERRVTSAIVDRPPLEVAGRGARSCSGPSSIYEVLGHRAADGAAGAAGADRQALLPDVPNWIWHEYGMRVGALAVLRSLRAARHQPDARRSTRASARTIRASPRRPSATAGSSWATPTSRCRSTRSRRPGGDDRALASTSSSASPARSSVGWLGPGLTQTLRDARTARRGRHQIHRRLGL